jgi:hypothetical protein
MRVARKFNLSRIGHQYESIEIEVDADTIHDAMLQIERAWIAYCRAIKDGEVQ